jgi:transcription termination factor NusB
MLYLKCDKVPENVSINEALELVKFYSDPQWRIFINWVLNSLKQNKTEVKKELTKITNKNLFFNN